MSMLSKCKAHNQMTENQMSNVLYKFSKQCLVGLPKVKVTILPEHAEECSDPRACLAQLSSINC